MNKIMSDFNDTSGKPVCLVTTSHDYPPIPSREADWSAVADAFYDEGEPVGRGPTEDAAVLDLVEQLSEDHPRWEGALWDALSAYLILAQKERREDYKRLLRLDEKRDLGKLNGFDAGYRAAVADLFGVFEA